MCLLLQDAKLSKADNCQRISLIESMPFHYLLVRHSHKAMYLVLYVWLILSALLSKAYQYAKSFHRCIHKNDMFQMFMKCFIIF